MYSYLYSAGRWWSSYVATIDKKTGLNKQAIEQKVIQEVVLPDVSEMNHTLINKISTLFSHSCLFQNSILHKMLKLGFCYFKPIFLNVVLIGCNISSLVLVICLSWYLHLKLSHESLTFGDKREQVFGLHIKRKLPDTLEATWSFQTFKRPISEYLGAKYKWKVISYMNNARVLLCNRPNLGFSLNFYFIVINYYFYCKFCAFLSTLYVLGFLFIPEWIKQTIMSQAFQVSKMGCERPFWLNWYLF